MSVLFWRYSYKEIKMREFAFWVALFKKKKKKDWCVLLNPNIYSWWEFCFSRLFLKGMKFNQSLKALILGLMNWYSMHLMNGIKHMRWKEILLFKWNLHLDLQLYSLELILVSHFAYIRRRNFFDYCCAFFFFFLHKFWYFERIVESGFCLRKRYDGQLESDWRYSQVFSLWEVCLHV